MSSAIDREYLADEERARKAVQYLVKRWDLDAGVLIDDVWEWIKVDGGWSATRDEAMEAVA